MRAAFIVSAVLVVSTPVLAAGERTRFWNLTANTIKTFHLAPAGSTKFGKNQCTNDKDGEVDHDERLRITDVTTGRYDVRFSDDKGRLCIVKNVEVKEGDIFSIEERDVKDCRK